MKVIVYYLSYSFEEEAEAKLTDLKEFFPGYKVLLIIDYDNTSDRIEVLDLYPPSYTQNYPYAHNTPPVNPYVPTVYPPNYWPGGVSAGPTTVSYGTVTGGDNGTGFRSE